MDLEEELNDSMPAKRTKLSNISSCSQASTSKGDLINSETGLIKQPKHEELSLPNVKEDSTFNNLPNEIVVQILELLYSQIKIELISELSTRGRITFEPYTYSSIPEDVVRKTTPCWKKVHAYNHYYQFPLKSHPNIFEPYFSHGYGPEKMGCETSVWKMIPYMTLHSFKRIMYLNHKFKDCAQIVINKLGFNPGERKDRGLIWHLVDSAQYQWTQQVFLFMLKSVDINQHIISELYDSPKSKHYDLCMPCRCDQAEYERLCTEAFIKTQEYVRLIIDAPNFDLLELQFEPCEGIMPRVTARVRGRYIRDELGNTSKCMETTVLLDRDTAKGLLVQPHFRN